MISPVTVPTANARQIAAIHDALDFYAEDFGALIGRATAVDASVLIAAHAGDLAPLLRDPEAIRRLVVFFDAQITWAKAVLAATQQGQFALAELGALDDQSVPPEA